MQRLRSCPGRLLQPRRNGPPIHHHGVSESFECCGETSLAITNFVRGCREARSDLTTISGELTQLHLVLDLLKDDASVGSGRVILEPLQAQILSIKNCTVVVGNIETVLEKHSESGKTGAVKWVAYGKAEVAGLRMPLEAHRGSLSLILELASLSISKSILEDVHIVKQDSGQIKENTSQIKQDTGHIMAELTRLRAIVAQGGISSATRGQNFVLEQYLDSLTSYAETVYNDADWDSDASSRAPASRKSSSDSDRLTSQGKKDSSRSTLSQRPPKRAPPSQKFLRRKEIRGGPPTPLVTKTESNAVRQEFDSTELDAHVSDFETWLLSGLERYPELGRDSSSADLSRDRFSGQQAGLSLPTKSHSYALNQDSDGSLVATAKGPVAAKSKASGHDSGVGQERVGRHLTFDILRPGDDSGSEGEMRPRAPGDLPGRHRRFGPDGVPCVGDYGTRSSSEAINLPEELPVLRSCTKRSCTKKQLKQHRLTVVGDPEVSEGMTKLIR
ncbi:hypothetical protein QBC34DRAFT_382447 [Podospora aff. communis PSN243]|uniref:Fungal N-terminal domain-containing protein n=1 Tax=Podospora aff. communis PSN243 TaxID=3040156 RepID=A0AAV9GGC0_9PEZI|nr:hypothetical protein QBC34DRAFT_382447 [Podospora aff. communis PSN243]